MTSCGFFFFSSPLSLATYTAEIYPTHLRALGGGVASALQRGASMVGTTVVGWVLPYWGINAVFVMFGLFALMGAVTAFFFAMERGKVLDLVSPPRQPTADLSMTSEAPHSGAYAELPGVRLSFSDTGGDGVPMMLLHPNTGAVAVWEPQISAFAQAGYRVICLTAEAGQKHARSAAGWNRAASRAICMRSPNI